MLIRFQIVFIGFALSFMSLQATAAFKAPRCKEMTKEVWTLHSDQCVETFKKNSDGNTSVEKTTKKLCACVADERVNKMTCKDIKKYESDAEYAATRNKKIASACTKKFAAQIALAQTQ